MPDIFDEVDEDLRAERARRFLVRYGGAMLGAAVAVVAAVAGWEAWRAYELRGTGRIADAYLAAARIADGPEAARRNAVSGFASVADEAGPGYRTIARLREAALKADAGDLPAALALWDQVAGDGQADPLLRDLASLRWATHQIDKGDPAQVASRLQPLAAPDNAWHSLAAEAQAMLALRQGKTDAARDTLRQLAQDVTAPDGVRGRANGLLSRLGS